MSPKPWPRVVGERTVEKVFRPDGSPGFIWFISSRSLPGGFRRVSFHKAGAVSWWTCSCPAGHYDNLKMGSRFENPCAHAKAVFVAEKDEGMPARPGAPANVSALVD